MIGARVSHARAVGRTSQEPRSAVQS